MWGVEETYVYVPYIWRNTIFVVFVMATSLSKSAMYYLSKNKHLLMFPGKLSVLFSS